MNKSKETKGRGRNGQGEQEQKEQQTRETGKNEPDLEMLGKIASALDTDLTLPAEKTSAEKALRVHFYDAAEDSLLKFSVIIARSRGKWVFCRHRERTTYEIPGGHREEGESVLETAERELREETGALKFAIEPVCVYSVTGMNRVNETGEETYGMLYCAQVEEFAGELHSEMEKVFLFEELPLEWTYPEIQPEMIREARRRGFLSGT